LLQKRGCALLAGKGGPLISSSSPFGRKKKTGKFLSGMLKGAESELLFLAQGFLFPAGKRRKKKKERRFGLNLHSEKGIG